MSDRAWSQASSGALSLAQGPPPQACGCVVVYFSLSGSQSFGVILMDSRPLAGWRSPGLLTEGSGLGWDWCREPSRMKHFGKQCWVELVRLWVHDPLIDPEGLGQGFLPFLFPLAPPTAQL